MEANKPGAACYQPSHRTSPALRLLRSDNIFILDAKTGANITCIDHELRPLNQLVVVNVIVISANNGGVASRQEISGQGHALAAVEAAIFAGARNDWNQRVVEQHLCSALLH